MKLTRRNAVRIDGSGICGTIQDDIFADGKPTGLVATTNVLRTGRTKTVKVKQSVNGIIRRVNEVRPVYDIIIHVRRGDTLVATITTDDIINYNSVANAVLKQKGLV